MYIIYLNYSMYCKKKYYFLLKKKTLENLKNLIFGKREFYDWTDL